MQTLTWFLPELSNPQWLVHALIFLLNISLLFFARPVLNLVDVNRNNESKLKIFKSLNVLVLILHVLDIALLRVSTNYESQHRHVLL